MSKTLASWVAALIALVIAVLLGGCAVFSDGASVDYSRFLAPTFQVFSLGGSDGGSQPWDADPGTKTHRSWQGNEPWSTWSHGDVEFRNYRGSDKGKKHTVVTCRTLSGIKFCN